MSLSTSARTRFGDASDRRTPLRTVAALLVLLALLTCGRTATPPAASSPAKGSTADAFATATATEPPIEMAASSADGTGSIPPRLLAPWTGDFDGMIERRYLRVLVAPSKTYYFVENGQPRGTAYEAFRTFEDEVNRALRTKHVKFHVVFIPTSRDRLLPALVEGRGDVAAAGITITPERAARIDFTRPMWSGVAEVAVTGPSSPTISRLDDLAGQEVFVRPSSSYWEHLDAVNRDFARRGLPAVARIAAPEDLEDEDLLEMLNAGAFGIAIVDEPIATLWSKVLPEIRVHSEAAVHTGGEIAWMIRKGSPKLKGELDRFAATRGKGTLFGNTIMKRYVGSTQFVAQSTSPAELEKFRRLVALFERYGSRYEVDPLLAMAQGYQESRLDQSVRSRVGAIGVMQIMPATARELDTGDVRELEPNINAGVKYIRFMIDRYFANEPMTRTDKALFAFASYNAGPARIAQLRKAASARGLDPNVWFNNVELIAAEKIGPETVSYVSNIYKYYVAYKLVAERDAARAKARAATSKR